MVSSSFHAIRMRLAFALPLVFSALLASVPAVATARDSAEVLRSEGRAASSHGHGGQPASLQPPQQDDQISGSYGVFLQHEGTKFYQVARLTLRTVNVGGQVKISANARVFFGDSESNEYLTYEYPEVPLNILTRQLSLKADANDVSFLGFLRGGALEGEWFSSVVGRAGTFRAVRNSMPQAPADGILVRTLSGHYRGVVENTNPQSNLPERLSVSFVTTQENSSTGPLLRITGNARFYLGGFDSLEYVETPFSNVQFNYYNRFLTAKTQEYGITFKGTMTQSGRLEGLVLSDGLGEVGKVRIARFP